MAKQIWKPGNMIYPLPAVMVSCQEGGRETKHHHGGVDGNRLYQPADGLYFGKTAALFV